MSCAAFSRPCSRSPCAAWIATLPNTAIAPVAAIATRARAPGAQLHHRDVRHRADDPRRQRAHERERRHQRQRQQQQQRGDQEDHPQDRQFRRGQQDRGGARQADQAGERELEQPTPPSVSAVRSPGAVTAGGRRERMSRSGLSTATMAASIPPPTATSTLCALTTRSEPTAKAEDR